MRFWDSAVPFHKYPSTKHLSADKLWWLKLPMREKQTNKQAAQSVIWPEHKKNTNRRHEKKSTYWKDVAVVAEHSMQ